VADFRYSIPGWFNYSDIYIDAVNSVDYNGHFVEIGSFLGKSTVFMAYIIKAINKNIKFDAIDLWDITLVSDKDRESYIKLLKSRSIESRDLYLIFLNNMVRYDVHDIVNPIKAYSIEAANNYENNSLDFVFIDTDHTYESMTKELEAWYPKIKPNGTLAGHDYDWVGVRKAVDEKFGKNNECSSTSWRIIK